MKVEVLERFKNVSGKASAPVQDVSIRKRDGSPGALSVLTLGAPGCSAWDVRTVAAPMEAGTNAVPGIESMASLWRVERLRFLR